jgi:hypothetical protein
MPWENFMSRAKRISDHCTIPLERGQRARWESAANRKHDGAAPADLADWIGPILDAAADYERAMGRSAAELLRLMVPVPLRPLLRAPGQRPGAGGMSPGALAAPGAPASPAIVVPTVGATATAAVAVFAVEEPAVDQTPPPEALLAGS